LAQPWKDDCASLERAIPAPEIDFACTHEVTHQHGDEAVEMRHVSYIEPTGPGLPATLVFDCSSCEAQITVRTTHTFQGVRLAPPA
jgi:hypothetical protein